MASAERQCGEAHLEHAEMIRNFIFTSNRQKSFNNHTEEEYREFCKRLMDYCYSEYREIAKYYSWI